MNKYKYFCPTHNEIHSKEQYRACRWEVIKAILIVAAIFGVLTLSVAGLASMNM